MTHALLNFKNNLYLYVLYLLIR